MAEAGVTGTPSTNPKFFCYKCNEEISHVQDDFTCPKCNGGFIEEVQTPSVSATSLGSQGSAQGSQASFDLGGLDFLQLLRGLSDPSGAQSGASVRFQSGSPQGNFRRSRSDGGTATTSPGGNSQHFSFVFDATRPPGAGGGRGSVPGGGQNSENPMENMLFSFLNELITGLGGGGQVTGAPVLSNFGDYVWGRDGLDAIVTQLMNQMEGTGPPPLATDKIDTLPDVKITQEHVDRKLQCSVCWDDFKVNEDVKQLECEHLYHPDCIIPWLKLHGTCPICRKDLTGQLPEDPNACPSPRFENSDGSAESTGTHSSSSDTNSSSNENSSTTTSDSTSSGGRPGHGHHHQQHSTNPNHPALANSAAALFNQFLDPLLMGLTGQGTGGPNQTNQSGRQGGPNSGPPGPRDGRQGPGSGGPGSGFDNMDLDFD